MFMGERNVPVADNRVFVGVYVCRNCNSKIRVSNPKLLRLNKVKCRKCGSRVLRPKHKELRKLKA
jgi:ribosomal protein L40E